MSGVFILEANLDRKSQIYQINANLSVSALFSAIGGEDVPVRRFSAHGRGGSRCIRPGVRLPSFGAAPGRAGYHHHASVRAEVLLQPSVLLLTARGSKGEPQSSPLDPITN